SVPWGSGLVAVAHARLGQQVPRAVRILLQLPPQPGHVEPEVVGAALEARSPDLAEQAVGADQLAGGVQQDLEQPPLGGREMQRLGISAWRGPDDRVRGEVDLAPADGEPGAARGPVVTAERGPQPGE